MSSDFKITIYWFQTIMIPLVTNYTTFVILDLLCTVNQLNILGIHQLVMITIISKI